MSRGESVPSISARQRIRTQCDRFEQAWKGFLASELREDRPFLTEYLYPCDEPERAALFRELLHLDIAYGHKSGRRLAKDDYNAKFAAYRTVIESAFELDAASFLAYLSTQDGQDSHETGSSPNGSCVEQEVQPEQIARYQVDLRIGSGGFGTVYRAYDPELRRFVAIKVPRSDRTLTATDIAAFLDEARTLAKLQHPHIVPVYDAGRLKDGQPFVVSQWIEGQTLATRIREGRPDVASSVELVATVAEALYEAHSRDIWHRDVKPGNILLDRNSKPYLADFGLALSEENFGQARNQGLTPAYASPEQAAGEGHRVDGRSDIFSLGVVLYELLTGRRPFRGKTRGEILDCVRNVEARPLREVDVSIPAELERICLKALSKRQSDRYCTAWDFAEDLRRFLESPSGQAADSTPSAMGRDRGGPLVFISYRREDSEQIVGRISDRLHATFGKESVFVDQVSIHYGEDFRGRIENFIENCDVVLAVIGPAWLGVRNDGTRRIDGSEDYPRIELEIAVDRGVQIIPLLIGNLQMPSQDELPARLKSLAYLQTCPIDPGRDFSAHMERLIAHLTTVTTQSTGHRRENRQARLFSSSDPNGPDKIIPKGLRSFDEFDADYYLQLLPGPTGRDGLPESIRFWKNRIEPSDANKTFTVGLIYGPSGCGKSSLVKAGILPRLAPHVVPIYIEATPEQTEDRLIQRLRNPRLNVPGDLSLIETIAFLRSGRRMPEGAKLLVVLDQFEQWLHGKEEFEFAELVQALRQCDGIHVQTIVMVRDDFWMAVTRFMRALEVRLVEGHNFSAVDLFSPHHAKQVLTAFGRAYGRLDADISKAQDAFLARAVEGLSEQGKVICVRLALFAEMMKGRPWTPGELRAVGGAHGLGVTFLDETFSARTAPPQYRYHLRAVRPVLSCMLPETSTDIKRQMCSWDELLAASGYARHPHEFEDLMRVLDQELRLVTPTDREGIEWDVDDFNSPEDLAREPTTQFYQLAHDYLVPSVREWVATRKGARAKLAAWCRDPQRIVQAGMFTVAFGVAFSCLEMIGFVSALLVFAEWFPSYDGFQPDVYMAWSIFFLFLALSLIWSGYKSVFRSNRHIHFGFILSAALLVWEVLTWLGWKPFSIFTMGGLFKNPLYKQTIFAVFIALTVPLVSCNGLAVLALRFQRNRNGEKRLLTHLTFQNKLRQRG